MASLVGPSCPTGTFPITPILGYLKSNSTNSPPARSILPTFAFFYDRWSMKTHPEIRRSILRWLLASLGLLLSFVFLFGAS